MAIDQDRACTRAGISTPGAVLSNTRRRGKRTRTHTHRHTKLTDVAAQDVARRRASVPSRRSWLESRWFAAHGRATVALDRFSGSRARKRERER